MREVNSGRYVAGRRLRKESSTVVHSCRISNEVDEFCSLDNTAVRRQKQRELLLFQSVNVVILTVHSQLK